MARSAISLVALCCLATALAASAPAPGPVQIYQRPLNQDCISSLANSAPAVTGVINLFPQQFRIAGTTSNSAADRVTVTVAKDFSVEYYDNYKVVRNLLVNETYVLYQCGTDAPPANYLPLGAKMFSIPLTSVAVLETVPIAFMTQLGVMSRAESVSSFAVGACGQAVLGCGKAAPSSLTLNATVLAPLLPLTDGVLTSSNDSSAATTFAFSASSDPGPLNRAEWIKFLGMFFNLDSTATQTFDSINSSYAQTKAGVKAAAKPPVLAFVDLYSYPPDNAYEVSLAAYKTQYTKDAGAVPPVLADILATKGVILSPNDLTNSTAWFTWNSTYGGFATKAEATAAFHNFLQGVDIVVDETYALNPTTYNITTFLTNMNLSSSDNYTFLANKAVYREDGLVSPAPAYGLDWFEGAIARPDLVLQDFVHAVNPSGSPTYKPTWIRNIATGQTVTITTAQNCNQISSCTAPATPICPFVSMCSNGTVVSQKNATSTCEYAACSS